MFSDSDSVHSVIEVNRKPSNFMSLAISSVEEVMIDDDDDEEDDDDFSETIIDSTVPSTSFAAAGSNASSAEVESVSDRYWSDGEEPLLVKFGSGKRALDHNTSSAFFSTVNYDDDYHPSDRDWRRSASPAKRPEKDDEISQDSLNTESVVSSSSSSCGGGGGSGSGEGGDDDRFRLGTTSGENDVSAGEDGRRGSCLSGNSKIDSAEICTIERSPSPSMVDGYRARDGIPKYVLLPNPYYRENGAAADRVKVELSPSGSDGIVPADIPKRTADVHRPTTVPVITVTEMTGGEQHRSPTSSLLRKIFVPSVQNDAYYNTYHNRNSSAFGTLLKRSSSPDARRSPSPDAHEQRRQDFEPAVSAVKHYGGIAEAYGGAARKPAPKTYLDFEQLKMAAHDDDYCYEPVIVGDGRLSTADYESDFESYSEEPEMTAAAATNDDDDEQQSYDDDRSSSERVGEADRSVGVDGTTMAPLADQQHRLHTPPPNEIPYLMIFGNLSLALFGYWLYACKDERASVPIFGFLFFRFFKTQVWDRIG